MLTLLRRYQLQAPTLTDLLAGVILGFMLLTESVSSAALIFAGPLAPSFPLAIGGIVVGSAIVIGLVAWRSQFPFAIARPDSNTYPILAIIAANITERLSTANTPAAILPTVWLTLTLGLVLGGLVMFWLGRLRLSQTLRFLPYPVVGGFLAGSGWLLMRGSFTVMAGVPLDMAQLSRLASSSSLVHWVPGVVLALALLVALRRFQHPLILPSLLLAAIALCHLGLWAAGLSPAEAVRQGWLLDPLTDVQLQTVWAMNLAEVNWQAVLSQTLSQLSVIAIAAIAIGLNAASLEVASGQDVDLDSELQTAGIGNMLAGVAGGMVVGALSASRSQLNQRTSVNGRLSGVLAALVCVALPFLAAPALSLLPRPVLGGLLLYLGLNHVVEWVYDGWSRLPHVEYGLVLVILFVIATTDFVRGVGIGVVIACILFVVNYSRFLERADDYRPYLERREVGPGDIIVRQGDPPRGMFYLREGLITIVFEAHDGRQHHIRRLGPGTLTGEMSLFTNAPRTASVIATEPSVLDYLSPEAVARMQRERPDLADALHQSIIRLLADRLFESNQQVANLLR